MSKASIVRLKKCRVTVKYKCIQEMSRTIIYRGKSNYSCYVEFLNELYSRESSLNNGVGIPVILLSFYKPDVSISKENLVLALLSLSKWRSVNFTRRNCTIYSTISRLKFIYLSQS